MAKLAILLFALVVGGCSDVGQRSLPHGYSWFSAHGSGGVIVDRAGDVVVKGNVDWTTIKVVGEQVFGTRTVDALSTDRPLPSMESFGRFKLETKTGIVSFGLDPKGGQGLKVDMTRGALAADNPSIVGRGR